MCVRFIGCLHLGHEWMAQHRGFKSADEYHQHLIKSWNSVVHKKDLVYILGDVTMEKNEFYPILDSLNGRKKVVLGNHDLGKHIPDLLKHVETVEGMVDYKGFALTHCPIHPNTLERYYANIHAHIHENEVEELEAMSMYNDVQSHKRPTKHMYINVDACNVNYKPRTINQLWVK